MPEKYSQLKILLIHIRENDEVANHEYHCVQKIAELEPHQIDTLNVGKDPTIEMSRVMAADAVIIGGSGHHSAYKEYEFTQPLTDAILEMANRSKPLLGSCWGHQFIARVLGGEVVHDPDRGEVGTLEIHGTDAAKSDPLFSTCPERYFVLMGHHDRVATLPPGSTELAYSQRCRNQAYRIDGMPIYGTQFHTELTPHTLLERMRIYPKYLPEDTGIEDLERTLLPTPDAERIMRRFLESLTEL